MHFNRLHRVPYFSAIYSGAVLSPKLPLVVTKTTFGADQVDIKPQHIKIRPNDELVQDSILPKLIASDFEKATKVLTIDLTNFPAEIGRSELKNQIHMGSYTRSLFYMIREALVKANKAELAKRMFVHISVDRNLLWRHEDPTLKFHASKTTTTQKYIDSMTLDAKGKSEEKAWLLFDKEPSFLSLLKLPARQSDQPFLITIGFVPEATQPLDPK